MLGRDHRHAAPRRPPPGRTGRFGLRRARRRRSRFGRSSQISSSGSAAAPLRRVGGQRGRSVGTRLRVARRSRLLRRVRDPPPATPSRHGHAANGNAHTSRSRPSPRSWPREPRSCWTSPALWTSPRSRSSSAAWPTGRISGSRSSSSTASAGATSSSTRTTGSTSGCSPGCRGSAPASTTTTARVWGSSACRASWRRAVSSVASTAETVRMTPGVSRSGPGGYIHAVAHHAGEPAVSIHAYSPPLVRVGQYRRDPAGPPAPRAGAGAQGAP